MSTFIRINIRRQLVRIEQTPDDHHPPLNEWRMVISFDMRLQAGNTQLELEMAALSLKAKVGPRNPQPQILNPKSSTPNPKTGTRNPEPGAPNPEL